MEGMRQEAGDGGPRTSLRKRLAEARERQAAAQRRAAQAAAGSGPSRSEQWGLTPAVTWGLILFAGVAMVSGLILTFSAPRSQEALADGAAAPIAPPTLMPAARPPAEDAVDDYLILVRQEMYDVAWSRTTPRFQADNYPGGIAAFQQAWDNSPELEIVSKKTILQGGGEANVVAEIHELDSEAAFTNSYHLVFDGASGLWLIDSVGRIW